MLGIGGIIGGVSGGLITQYANAHYVFYIFGLMGFLIMIAACSMDNAIEAEQLGVINMSLCNRVSTNFSDIKTGFKVRELTRSVIFFLLLGSMKEEEEKVMLIFEVCLPLLPATLSQNSRE